MMKSLYSGVSGLRSHQVKMDVIGNNIANVNTNGYKSQRTTFRDVYYQTLKSPSEGTTNRGGINVAQVGYGTQIGSIDTIHTISGYTPTDKATDLYISGDGYFVVKNPNGGGNLYTRLGALNIDSQGNLVDVNGSKVCGANGTTAIDSASVSPITVSGYTTAKITYKNITIGSDGKITATKTDNSAAPSTETIETLGQIAVAYVPNEAALVSEGNSYYSAGKNAGIIAYYAPGGNGVGSVVSGGLEMSNVDLAKEFTDMIITQRGFQANSKIITVADEMLQDLVNLKR